MPDNNTPYKEIPLTKGKVALVDPEDYESLSRFKWQAVLNPKSKIWYARRTATDSHKKRFQVWMHRDILSVPRGMEVDHKNGNGLDNCRSNLRIATATQNRANTPPRKTNKTGTGFKGVFRRPGYRRWHSSITTNGRRYFIGAFDTAEEAAIAYNQKAKEQRGEFAWLNPVDSEIGEQK
jgi:hypothetical protein